MRPLHHASVFSPYIFPKYIYFLASLLSRLTVLGYLSILEPVLWQMIPSPSQFFCCRWLHLMENLCLVPMWTLALLKMNECCLLLLKIIPWCHQRSGCRTLLGNGQLTLWSTYLSPDIFVEVKNVRPGIISVHLGMVGVVVVGGHRCCPDWQPEFHKSCLTKKKKQHKAWTICILSH